jgi:hypothetical protein
MVITGMALREALAIGGVALLLTAALAWWVWTGIVHAWNEADEGDGWDTDNGPYHEW